VHVSFQDGRKAAKHRGATGVPQERLKTCTFGTLHSSSSSSQTIGEPDGSDTGMAFVCCRHAMGCASDHPFVNASKSSGCAFANWHGCSARHTTTVRAALASTITTGLLASSPMMNPVKYTMARRGRREVPSVLAEEEEEEDDSPPPKAANGAMLDRPVRVAAANWHMNSAR
jgi:hypothetical protein